MMDNALDLVRVGLTYDGERITEPGELPDDLDDLATLASTLGNIAQVARRLRAEVESTLADLLGPGGSFRQGEHVISYQRGWKWRPQSTTGAFVVSVAEADPAAILDLFPMGSIRKTGVEKVARQMGLDPETVVATVLDRARDDEPSIQRKWKPIMEDSHDNDSDEA